MTYSVKAAVNSKHMHVQFVAVLLSGSVCESAGRRACVCTHRSGSRLIWAHVPAEISSLEVAACSYSPPLYESGAGG